MIDIVTLNQKFYYTPMRQKLITLLTEEVVPAVNRTRDPKGEILKAARANNFLPSQVQALGQLFNTARTLAHFEKAGTSEARGASFPILDVDKLVAEYQTAEPLEKKASAPVHWELDDQTNNTDSLPDCFRGICTPALKLEVPVRTQPSAAAMAKAAAKAQVESAREVAMLEQLQADTSHTITKLARSLWEQVRNDPEQNSFDSIEADALGLFGEKIRPTMDKLASACVHFDTAHRPIKRAAKATEHAILEDDREAIMNLIDQVDSKFFEYDTCTRILKAAAAPPAPPPTKPQSQQSSGKGQGSSKPSSGGADPKPLAPVKPGQPAVKDEGVFSTPGATVGQVGRGITDSTNDVADNVLGKILVNVPDTLKSLMPDNSDQRLVDTEARDVRHQAMLQNLLITDPILSEADPDKVLDIYHTVRTQAPDIAGDINVMRVLLRSAIQHDGMTPFDLKQLIETNSAAQKVEENRRKFNAQDYGGKPVSGGKDS